MIKSCHVPKLKEIRDIYFRWMKTDVWACFKKKRYSSMNKVFYLISKDFFDTVNALRIVWDSYFTWADNYMIISELFTISYHFHIFLNLVRYLFFVSFCIVRTEVNGAAFSFRFHLLVKVCDNESYCSTMMMMMKSCDFTFKNVRQQ